ncbi:toxic anion resistance protein [Carnobacterium divergens]|uniref:Putative tellurite resistance protein n=1 Tax=Carnobacterium divergens DSM 20623 TaxID=1449336 RepID=A0A0R2HWY4_CARDV|nr:toxic anion resistance protein [Carnobacterium divergens]AOA00236.1 tellurite resistance protein TelA [Carnobacterium divergens]KRN54615.1 putative tellurite resistance protein [Carnobacterium divergens DSM 20623]MDO0874100.1 toxic anion resistance protein [Carnobacterium divergens]MDT2011249.1 toxic anion resistance protein [Carnobacterium divergens]TFJ38876.1 toxic anion resistance protein [Carnobacterium divergens]
MTELDDTIQPQEPTIKEVNNELDELLANPFSDATAAPSVQVDPLQAVGADAPAPRMIDRLPKERQVQAKALAEQIDVANAQAIMSYGAAAQQKLGEFSHTMLNHVQNQDTGEIGESLNDLMYRLNEANPDELRAEDNNVFKKIFGKVRKSIYEMTSKYQKIGAQIDKIAIKLDREKNGLLNDNMMLEQLYQKNKDYFDALNIYIAAGEVKMEELQVTLIPEAIKQAEQSNDQMDVQVVNDLNQFLDRLEKRTHDLRLARQMTIQQAPQIRLIQNTNQALAEKIQSSINTAIPLWKNQIAIALTLLRQKDAVTAQRQVSETTNDLLKKNSAMLKISAIETAKENERGVIDIETLQQTQDDLVETLQETLKIQQEGRVKRKEAEKELSVMETDLRDKLLALTSDDNQANQYLK